MKEALNKMKELTKNLKEQKEVVKDEAPADNKDLNQFMDQLNELTNMVTPQKKIIDNPQSNNQEFRPRDKVSPPPNRSVPYVPAQNVPKFSVKYYYLMEEEEPFGYAYGLRNTKQRIENQEKSKAQPLPSKVTIQPKDTIKKKTSIPGGFIEEEEAEEGKLTIPTEYKSPKPEEVVKPPEPTKPNTNTSEKEKETNKKAIIKQSKVEVNKKPLVEEEGPIIEKVMKKVMDQKINLNLEEIVAISP
ncbi:hypothetical protein O181_090196, partial [Austropuccinia psidii MF-1]|nr:hypothetical protein [Austropuccinia psidii MF-1]